MGDQPKSKPYARLPILILAITAIALSLAAITLYAVERRLIALSGETLSLAAADIADKLDLVLYERANDAQAMAKVSAKLHKDHAGLSSYLASIQQAYPIYLWLGVTDRNGQITAATDPRALGEDWSRSDWFQAARQGLSIHVQDPQVSELAGGIMAIAFTAPIIGSQDDFLGVVTGRVSLASLEDLFSRTVRIFQNERRMSDSIEWEFLARDGSVLSESRLSGATVNLLNLATPSARLSLDPTTSPGYIEEQHVRRQVPVVTGYAHTNGYGRFVGPLLGVLVREDRRSILASVRTTTWKLGAVGTVMIIPLLGLLLWITARLQNSYADLELRVQKRTEELSEEITERTQAERRLAAQHVMTQVLAESPTLEEASPKILQVLCECLGWEVGSLWRVDPDANLLRCLEIWQTPKTKANEFMAISQQRTFAPGVGMPGRVWSRGEPAWIPDVLKDSNFPRAPMAAKAGLHGAIGFPIKIGKNVYGIIEFFSCEIREPDVYLLQMASDIGVKIGQFIERKQMEAHANEIERLTTQGQLTDGIAHEMKNPLFVLTGRIQLMKEKLAQHEYGTLSDDLLKIESAATRMASIADRFSKLVKSPSSSPEPTAVQMVLTQVLELLADELTKNRIAVTTALAPDLPTIQANPRQLQNAFTNLIMNAMQAMAAAHGKGILTVTTALQNGWIEVRIQDDGLGIAPEHRARLFEPFFTTKLAGQGTGMGLWTVRSAAMALRGTVACETDTGKGATFIMRLPAVK